MSTTDTIQADLDKAIERAATDIANLAKLGLSREAAICAVMEWMDLDNTTRQAVADKLDAKMR